MNLKKILSGPFVWIFVAVTVLLIGSSLVNTSGVKQVDTQVGLAMIADGKADTVKVLDGDQRVDVTLTNEDAKYGKKVQFFYVAARGSQVVETVANAQIANGYNDEVPNTPWYLALLGSLLPFIIIGLIFWFLMSGLQGGNSKAFLGRPVIGEVIDSRAHRGIVSYDSTELVLSARAGRIGVGKGPSDINEG